MLVVLEGGGGRILSAQKIGYVVVSKLHTVHILKILSFSRTSPLRQYSTLPDKLNGTSLAYGYNAADCKSQVVQDRSCSLACCAGEQSA